MDVNRGKALISNIFKRRDGSKIDTDETADGRDLDFYRQLHYDVILKKRKGRFVVFIPEVTIIEENEKLEKAEQIKIFS